MQQRSQVDFLQELEAKRGYDDDEEEDEDVSVGASFAFERELQRLRHEGVLLPDEQKAQKKRKRDLKPFDFVGGR